MDDAGPMTDRIRETESYLASLPRFTDVGGAAFKPGLARVGALLEAMGRPQEGLSCVHVAGTNGKGSTASFIAAIATAAGLRAGLHTSPHLFHVTERMRVDGRPASREWLADAVNMYRKSIDEIGPSFFEATVALSLAYFAEADVDVAVVEVGMGGRLDATNILTAKLAVITDIGLDHVEFLGDSIEAVAREKAGIIKVGIPVVTGAGEEASAVIRSIAEARHSEYHHVSDETAIQSATLDLRGTNVTVVTPVRTYRDVFVGLPGKHQIRNARTALRAAELSFEGIRADHRPVFEGMRHVRELSGLRARLEVVRDDPLILADVGHNVDGLAAALQHLSDVGRPKGRLVVLFGVMRDKNVNEMARLLAHSGALVRPVHTSSSRALPVGELAHILEVCEVDTGEPCTVAEGIQSFLSDASHADILLITGSHLVVSQLEEASI